MSRPPAPHCDLQGTSRFIAFLDECGDHTLQHVDRDFPLFVLATVIVERGHYTEEVVTRFNRLKLSYWDHEGINLHSRDIRKSVGPFSILQHRERRERFMAELSGLMAELSYTLFLIGIDKRRHLERYAERAWNPYELALTFTFERIVHLLEAAGETHLPVIAEARGKKEDRALEVVFGEMLANGTQYVPASRLNRLSCPLLFETKLKNICGVQLADLCAHPCARHILKPEQPNRAYEIVEHHLYRSAAVTGWKVFP